ncbi:TPA: hypothetical protein LA460_000295 [Clostridium botulinum]|nr:hypothetical protein [Clostridium botulinum]HBJ1652899.1 hypothetical protein [Clostridium botulinum]
MWELVIEEDKKFIKCLGNIIANVSDLENSQINNIVLNHNYAIKYEYQEGLKTGIGIGESEL